MQHLPALEAVQAALTRVLEKWSRVLRYEDLEYAEIVALLEVSEVSARSYVHRALAAMRVELERQEQADG